MIPTLIGITVMTFCIIRFAPGDPAAMSIIEQTGGAGLSADRQRGARIELAKKKLLGLDKPIHIQYITWLKRCIFFDFGLSYKDHQPVRKKIWDAFKVSFALNIISIFFIYLYFYK